MCSRVVNNFKVTAVIPTYNSNKFIVETINSLINQTLQLDEIIIVDDNSSDNTIEIVKELKLVNDYIKIHQLGQNVGSSEARNIGIKNASNDWVLMMDHDDIAEPGLLEKECTRLLELKDEYPGEDWVLIHSAYSQIDENGIFIPGIHRWKQVRPYEILGYEFVRNRIISNSGALLNRKKALEIGGYDKELVYSQDWDLWLRLAQVGGFAYIDEPLVRIRRHSNNTSRDIKNFSKDEKRILQKYSLDFIERAIYNRDLSDVVNKIDFVSVLFKLNRDEKALQIIKEVIKEKPDLPAGHFLLGINYLKSENYTKAQESFETVLVLQPENAAAINNLACLNLLSGNKEKAKELLIKVLNMLPDYMDASYNLNNLEEKKYLTVNQIKFTWRELRPVLLRYS